MNMVRERSLLTESLVAKHKQIFNKHSASRDFSRAVEKTISYSRSKYNNNSNNNNELIIVRILRNIFVFKYYLLIQMYMNLNF
jgi:hypothetical protein